MTAVASRHWNASDGVDLVWHEAGQGRVVILLHGLFSDANMNWIKFGHAERIAAAVTEDLVGRYDAVALVRAGVAALGVALRRATTA